MKKFDRFMEKSTLSTKEEIEKVNIALDKQAGESVFKKLPTDLIHYNPKNDYAQEDSEGSIALLADDIEHNGLLHNIVVNENLETGEYTLISGERRLRAIKLLQGNPEKNAEKKWDMVQARVFSGLSERRAMIMLDAANLQTRGGAGDEAVTRRGLNRYIENLKAEFDISETAALRITKQIVSYSKSTILSNRAIELKFNNDMKRLIDIGVLSKKWSVAMLDFTDEEQNTVVSILTAVNELKYSEKKPHERENTIREYTRRIIEVADNFSAEDRPVQLKKVLEHAISFTESYSQVPELTSKALVRSYAANSRAQYEHSIQSFSDTVRKLNTRKKLDAMAKYELATAEGEESITRQLDGAIEQLTSLRERIAKLAVVEQIISTGKMPDGSDATPEQIAEAKKDKKTLIS